MQVSDGMTFDTSGSLHVVCKTDGYYVVGDGYLIPVDSREEGEQTIQDMLKTE